MSTLVDSTQLRNKSWMWIAFAAALMLAAVATPKLMQSRMAADESVRAERLVSKNETRSNDAYYYAAKGKPAMSASRPATSPANAVTPGMIAPARKMIRTNSLDLVVQHPAEAAEKILTLAEHVGGFLVSSEVRGGQNATAGSLTIRVPVDRFEEVRAEIRKLGLRIESEKVEAQDVTRQYVDQEATLRNLRAEETQYLAILKQARTVKDTINVTEQLSEVRGQIEQQQAEFDALSKQVETVAITVALRAEAEAQVFGLSWRPLYQMKLALRDGLDGVGDYASTMTAIVFYLPAIVLWLGTILIGAVLGWKVIRWLGRRVFGFGKAAAVSAPQG